MGYLDSSTGKTDQIFGSIHAKERAKIKEDAGRARRAGRYQNVAKKYQSRKVNKITKKKH